MMGVGNYCWAGMLCNGGWGGGGGYCYGGFIHVHGDLGLIMKSLSVL